MAKIRDNLVIFESSKIKEMSYVDVSLVVTKGQPSSETVLITSDEGMSSILIKTSEPPL